MSWRTPVLGEITRNDPLFGGYRLLAYNLKPSDAGTFTCSVPSVGNLSAQLSFIGKQIAIYIHS